MRRCAKQKPVCDDVMDISNDSSRAKVNKSAAGKRVPQLLRRCVIGLLCLCLVVILARYALRYFAISQISKLTSSKVESKSVHVGLDGSVLIQQLAVKPRQEQRDDYAILKAATVCGRFDIGSLFLLRPRLEEVTVSDFVLEARYDLDTDRWNIADFKIKAPNGGSAEPPVIHLEGGTVKYSKVTNGQCRTIAAIPVEAELEPAEEKQDGYEFAIVTGEAPWGLSRSQLTGTWKPGRITISGGFSSADIEAFEKVWTIYVIAAELEYDHDNNYSLKLVTKDLENRGKPVGEASVAPEPAILRRLGAFPALQRFFSRYDPQGRFDIELRAGGNVERLPESTLSGIVHCRDVSICDRDFPYTVEHITGQIEFTQNSAELRNLHGRHADVELTFSGRCEDSSPNRQYDIQITSENMALDSDLFNALSEKRKQWWSVVSPAGLASIDYRMVRHAGAAKEGTLAVELLNAEAVYRRFPYPLKNLTGRMLFDKAGVKFSDVVSQYCGRKIVINGTVAAHGAEQPPYDFEIRAQDIPLDSMLSACLSGRQRRLYERLNISGLADVEVKVLAPEHNQDTANVETDISIKKACLKPDYLPLAVSEAWGRIFATRDSIRVENLKGRCGPGTVSVTGRIWPGDDEQEVRYDLSLHGEQVELNEDLFALLPSSLKEVVSELQPSGRVNYVADLHQGAAGGRPDYQLTVDFPGNGFKLESFPYPLRSLIGRLTITTERISGGSITPAGDVRIRPEGQALKITGELAQVDDEAGDTRLDLDLENVRIFDAEDGNKCVDLAATATFKKCDLSDSTGVTDLDAVLKLRGLYKRGEGFHRGQAIFQADGLRINGNCFGGLSADIDYDRRQQCWLSRNLIAECYGGKVAGKLELKQAAAGPSEYLLQIYFDDIDLREFLLERAMLSMSGKQEAEGPISALTPADTDSRLKETAKQDHTSGKMCGALSVSGRIGDVYSRIGRFRMTISDMRVGKMSPLGKVLCVLKLTEPTDFAFDRMFVDSYIKQNGVLFEHMDLSGESLAFSGSGRMDLSSRNLDLVLFARGARLAAAEPSFLQSLTEGVGQALVRLEVSGNYDDPKVTTTALPVIRETLGILGTRRSTPHR
ncbi:MAG TPA: hypothetical protein VMX13_02765 [Sedimentisphaerales bacterium]|nr:hypothetical protein [Sedimentisphaerales bacterium]